LIHSQGLQCGGDNQSLSTWLATAPLSLWRIYLARVCFCFLTCEVGFALGKLCARVCTHVHDNAVIQ
jgi:hypothetical protein